MSVSPRRPKTIVAMIVAVCAVLAVAAVGFASCAEPSDGAAGKVPSASSDSGQNQSPGQSLAALKPAGMATIAESALPEEARDVVRRIDAGGPFKYRQDGVTFENRERRLPAEPSGYYREYTVTTPGAPDRGARRLIQGREGQLYYTPDHYRSFFWVVRGGGSR